MEDPKDAKRRLDTGPSRRTCAYVRLVALTTVRWHARSARLSADSIARTLRPLKCRPNGRAGM